MKRRVWICAGALALASAGMVLWDLCLLQEAERPAYWLTVDMELFPKAALACGAVLGGERIRHWAPVLAEAALLGLLLPMPAFGVVQPAVGLFGAVWFLLGVGFRRLFRRVRRAHTGKK